VAPESESTEAWILLVGFWGTLALGAAETQVSPAVSLDVLYLALVLLVTWKGGPVHGLVVAVAASAMHALNQLKHVDAPTWVTLWNAVALLGALGVGIFLLSALLRVLERERALARTDSLTGLLNRREFHRLTELELARAARTGDPVSLAALDLDGFKGVNDRFGHAAGDACLVAVADVLRTRARRTDLVARVGGDEFAVLLPGADDAAAVRVLEDFRRELEAHMRAKGWAVSASVGLVQLTSADTDVDALMRRADEGMYAAKRDGKDQVRVG
jgi:diguanylate cyclase (GGDEF)-like protein